MGKRGRKGTVISRLRDIRSFSYRKARGFCQCQLAQWSWIGAGELAGYFIVIWFSLCSYSSPASIPKEMENAAAVVCYVETCMKIQYVHTVHVCRCVSSTWLFKRLYNLWLDSLYRTIYLTFLSKISYLYGTGLWQDTICCRLFLVKFIIGLIIWKKKRLYLQSTEQCSE